MTNYRFITVRLGKDSIDEIDLIESCASGILFDRKTITVRCTQVPDNLSVSDYAFIWLGSDNNKGAATSWKQGFKAMGIVRNVAKGEKYNDFSETTIEILYVFKSSISRLDFLKYSPTSYYWCSNMPLIGIDDHANQTIRSIGSTQLSDIHALFCSFDKISGSFKEDIIRINPDFKEYFSFTIPNPQKYPNANSLLDTVNHKMSNDSVTDHYLPYLTALRTKPFMLLAGISGTGKSRIVREMAKACWKEGDEEYGKNNPKNFCMVQVKPNWHDSTELMGYVTRIGGKPEYVAGDFIKFVVKAWYNEDIPYFLCLDEMNLAPVEQYFAEYLSVIESRKMCLNGMISTDPILKAAYHRDKNGTKEPDEWYVNLIDNLLLECPNEKLFAIRNMLLEEGISIPQNFFVVGTVNMDETTFSFSRKVLDRAMTIEMNEVDLHGGLEKAAGNEIGYIGNSIIGEAAEGCDVYEDNKDLCDTVLEYLEKVNAILEGTPFKIAYRTRNEFLMYAVNRKALASDSLLWQTLDEMTCMKILSRIEGDEERTKKVLDGLRNLVEEQIVAKMPTNAGETPALQSISNTKITEMLSKLKATGFTSYWT